MPKRAVLRYADGFCRSKSERSGLFERGAAR